MGHPVRLTITTTFSEGVYYFVVDSTETIAGIKALLEPEVRGARCVVSRVSPVFARRVRVVVAGPVVDV